MNLLATGPNQEGIKDAVTNAARMLEDPQANLREIAKQIMTDIAKALDPQSNPEATLNKIASTGVDAPAIKALGVHMSIFKLVMDHGD